MDGADKGYYLVYVATSESIINLQQHNYTEGEIDYFRIMLRTLMDSDTQSLSSIEASNLVTQVTNKPPTKLRAEQLLEKWCKLSYFVNINGNYYFGPKGLAEFSSYFQQHYKEKCVQCEICKTLVFWVNIF